MEENNRISEFEKKLGYYFKDKDLLETALTHTSYANECGCDHNERLEFLGDSVLGMAVSSYIYQNYPKLPEGKLTKVRAFVVCEESLAELAQQLEIGSFLQLGKGELAGGGASRASILADAFEAIVAAMYLDTGLEQTAAWIIQRLKDAIERAAAGKVRKDYKTQLQEMTQKGDKGKVTYRVISETGPDHEKEFAIAVYIDGKQVATGHGASKKEAEQAGAAEALDQLNQ